MLFLPISERELLSYKWNMNRLSIYVIIMMMCLPVMAQKNGSKVQEMPNPNFHIYLCFGQSNMEGNAAIVLTE